MNSPDDYDFEEPKYQADLNSLLDRIMRRTKHARTRLDLESPWEAMLATHMRDLEAPAPEPEPEPAPAPKQTVESAEQLRASLKRRPGAKCKPISDAPILDIELIEKMFQRGATLEQIRAHLRVGAQTLKLELLTHLPHIAKEAGKRRGRKPKEIDLGRVRQMRKDGMALHLISETLGVDHKRLRAAIRAEPGFEKRLGHVDTASVLRLHGEGLTPSQIAAALGCHPSSIYRRLKRA
jgi:hypothetical protein